MQLVDSHCHLDFSPLLEELPRVLQNASDNHVSHMLCVSVNLEDYPRIAKIAATHSHIFASVGVHPNNTDCQDPSVEELVELANNPDVVAIGETGLDYFRNEEHSVEARRNWQKPRFENHIEAAKIVKKPLIVHTRSAAEDTMTMLENLDSQQAGGVMHCFAEDWETAKRALDIGFYISFSGIVTFKNAENLKQIAKKVPLDRMLVETDSPYLAPMPYRGKVNEPGYVLHTAEHVAELRGDTLDNIATATTDNFFRLFSGAKRVEHAA